MSRSQNMSSKKKVNITMQSVIYNYDMYEESVRNNKNRVMEAGNRK